jgi:mycofactocin precursor
MRDLISGGERQAPLRAVTGGTMSEPTMPDVVEQEREQEPEAGAEPRRDVDEALVEDDLLVEDVSIDGMCGVY